jgi:GAF domain-containing protein
VDAEPTGGGPGDAKIVASSPLTETLDRAVQTCVAVIDHCDMAAISVAKSGRVRTLAASNELLRIIDDLQFQLHEGACFDALAGQDAVTATDLATDPRWPRWGTLVSERTGLHASLSFRLAFQDAALGTLNLYSETPASFIHQDAVLGHVVAAHTAAAVAQTRQVEQLTQALESRTVIGQATGILMERFGLDAEASFGVLRRISQANNTKIASLAMDLVAHGRLPDIET